MVVFVYAVVPATDDGNDSPHYVDAISSWLMVEEGALDDFILTYDDSPTLTPMQNYMKENNWTANDVINDPALLIGRLSWMLAEGEQITFLGWGDDPTVLTVNIDIGDISALEASMGELATAYAASIATRRISEGLLKITELDAHWVTMKIYVKGVGAAQFEHHHIQAIDGGLWRFMDENYIHYVFFVGNDDEDVNHTYTYDDVIIDEYDDYANYDEENVPIHPLIDSWASSGQIYYVFRYDGRGTVTQINMDWRVNDGTLYICRSSFLCGDNCATAIPWRYSIEGDNLTLTSVNASLGIYTFVRASAVDATVHMPPSPPSDGRACFQPVESVRWFIGNRNSMVFHSPRCRTLPEQHNRIRFNSRADAINAGHRPCGNCNP